MAEAEQLLAELLHRRSEMAGLVEQAETQLRQRVIDLERIDATIRTFEPEIKLVDVRPKALPPRKIAWKGEVRRAVVGALRTATGPMNAEQLAGHVMVSRGMLTTNGKLRKLMTDRVSSALQYHRRAGLVRSLPGPDRWKLWLLVEG